MAFIKCEGAFLNIVFQKMICHKSDIYLCNSAGNGCRCFFKYYVSENHLPQEHFCVFQYYLYGYVFLEKARKIEKSAEKFSKKKN